MIRISTFNKYEPIIRLAFQRFINEAKFNALDIGDFLVCEQGGFIAFGGPCIGLGEVGLNNLQKVNTILNIGPMIITEDQDYFKKNGDAFFYGCTPFEKSIMQICNIYLDIWENELFLRNFIELIKIANGEHYDWNLDLSKLKDNGKGRLIREEIIGKLEKYPYLQELLKIAYNSNLRNAVGHSQFHLVQGGIYLDTFGRNRFATVQGFNFEQWEKIFVYSWLVFKLLFSVLKQTVSDFFFRASKTTLSGGIPILIPSGDNWVNTFVYPNQDGKVWRFSKC